MIFVIILAFIIAAGVVWWAATRLIAAFSIPDPLATVIIVVLVLLMLFAFLQYTGVLGGPLILHR